MATTRGVLSSLAAGAFLFALAAHGQDAPSLGDVARQARLEKQQKDAAAKGAPGKDSQGKDTPAKDVLAKDALPKDVQASKTKKVVTNDEIPEHVGPTRTTPNPQTPGANNPQPDADAGGAAADEWKDQILAQKNSLLMLQSQIAELANSIQYAGSNCVANCVQWNERQQQKQGQLETMKAQLEQTQKNLEEMQDAARKQGFGSSVYDP